MARKPQEISITAIAREAGVSESTVSRVMNRRTGVSEETRRRVDLLLRARDFKPNYPAPRSPSIAVILPRVGFGPYVGASLSGVYSGASRAGVNVSIIMKDIGLRETILERIRELQCSGVIVILPDQLEDEHLALCRSELPVIFLDTTVNIKGIGYINNDSYTGAKAAAEHLLSLGHRKIAFLRWETQTQNQTQRLDAYHDVLRAADIDTRPEWIISDDPRERGAEPPFLAGARLARRVTAAAPDVTAVMATDDTLAAAALSEFQRRGLRVPGDISITGFDNNPESLSCWPSLTTVARPIEEAAAMAAESISRAIESPGKWIPPAKIFPTRLIIRESTGPAKRK